MERERIAPTQADERIVELDMLRGLAVLGILLVNMKFFYGPFYPDLSGLGKEMGLADRMAEWGIVYFGLGKFYTLFSFLFGLGLALQMSRASARHAPFVAMYLRRLGVLFLIGLAHIVFLWAGDILTAYAILGVPLLLLRHRPDRSILRWSVFFLLLPVLISAGLWGLIGLARMTPEGAAQMEQRFAAQAADLTAQYVQSRRVYTQGAFAEIVAQRLQDVQFASFRYIFNGNGPHIFAAFLFGLFVGRRGWFRSLPACRPHIRRLAGWGFALGAGANALLVFAETSSHPAMPSAMGILKSASFAVGAPAFCGFYVSALLLLAQRDRWRRLLAPLSAVGRLALSNYLAQSLICTTIFYGYGLGLYGTLGPAAGLGMTVLIWIPQLLLSAWWVKHFRFGPVEWLWRSLSYRRLQPMTVLP